MPAFLDSLVKVSGGFQAAVNLKANINDDAKVSGYIPTHIASEILNDLASNFHTTSARRSRLITGTYGTGKSHLALIIARIFRDGVEHPSLLPVMEKLNKWPQVAENLKKERDFRAGKYLLVNLLGDEGDFKDTLLRELDKALVQEGLSDLFPDTAFAAAGRRIEEIRQKYPTHYSQLEAVVTDHGFVSIDALEIQLKNKQKNSYDKFLKIYEEVFAGNRFDKNHNMKPEEVYKEVSKRIVEEKGYAGIAVIWDEFGRYLERIVEEPHGKEGEAIQNFADGCCNLQGEAQVHLYLLCHRTLKEYGAISTIKRHTNISQYEMDEWKKIEGRFSQFIVKTSAHEIFNLIDHVIVQDEDNPEWKGFVKAANDYFDEETDQAKTHRIFPEFNREEIHSIVTLGCYPLHPMAAFCLPLISQRVGQDNRTLFTFLSESGTGTFGPYLHSTKLCKPGAPPPFFTSDLLWDYFAVDMEKDPLHKRIFTRFTQADVRIDPDDILGKRIIKIIALLQILNSDRAPAKEETIAYCLAVTSSNRPQLKEKLKSLCLKDADRDSVLAQSLDGLYRFTGMVADGFTAELERTVETRKVKPIAHLRAILNENAYIDRNIEASRYGLDYSIDRKLAVECVSLEELSSPSRWLDNLGKGEYLDGYALIVMCEDSQEIQTAKDIIKTKLTHPQILIAMPKSGVKLSSLLRYHEAIKHLGRTNAAMYGPGAPLHDEWEEHFRDYTDHIVKEIEGLIKPDNEKLEWIMNGEVQANIRSKSHVAELASKMMFKVFSDTPKIVHDKLTSDDGNDSFKRERKEVIDKLLQKDGPQLLAQETSTKHKNIIDNFYKRNGVLRIQSGKADIIQPGETEFPAMHSVWKIVEDGIAKAKGNNGLPVSMTETVNTLRKPPYGLRVRTIPLIIAAVFRKENLLGNVSLLEGNKRADKINGEIIDKAAFHPTTINLHYEAFGEIQRSILYGVADAFELDTSKEKDKGELVAEIHEKIKSWWFSLSQFSQTTGQINRGVVVVREKILKKLIADNCDIYDVLMKELAEELLRGNDGKRITEAMVASNFKRWKDEIDNAIINKLLPSIKMGVCEVFGCTSANEWGDSIAAWWSKLNQVQKEFRLPGDSSTLAVLCADSDGGEPFGDEQLRALAKSFTGLDLEKWQDVTLERFKGSLGSAKRSIDAYVAPPPPEPTIVVPPGKAVLTINTETGPVSRTFVTVDHVSEGGNNFKNMLKGIIAGMGMNLPAGECESILLEIMKEYLK